MQAQEPNPQPDPARSGLLNDVALLKALFPDEGSRPSLRWLRSMRQRRLIPHYRIGGRIILFDPAEVRVALERQFKVEVRP